MGDAVDETTVKISMILLSICSPPGRVQREILQMKINNRLQVATLHDRWVSSSHQYFTDTPWGKKHSHYPNANYLQNIKIRHMNKNDDNIIFFPWPIYCDFISTFYSKLFAHHSTTHVFLKNYFLCIFLMIIYRPVQV